MPTQTITAKITKKAKNGKGFILEGQEGWFNANDKAIPFLAKIDEGKVVEVTYFQKGVKREVTLIKEVSGTTAEAPKETHKEDNKGTYTNCSVCGKELKGNGVNYPKCWDCKDKEPKSEVRESATGFVCEDCGKALKDDKYKKCFLCNKKSPNEEKSHVNRREKEELGEQKEIKYTNYDNPEKTAQIQRGNALNAAGAAVGGNFAGSDPQTIAEAVKIIADLLYDFLRAE
jgi:predicted RNA-binding Zn-ribbon protein involved in translation (DUF1610 family)